MSYRLKRYITYAIITFAVIGLPFIQINHHQIFLLSFDHKELHLLGSAFSMQELYVMPFLLILLFVGIFFATTLLGRVWCGWACPQTIFRVIYRDLIEGVFLKLNKISNKQKPQDLKPFSHKLKKLIGLALITLITFSASAVFLFYFVPPSDFFTYLSSPAEHPILLGFWLCIGIFFTFDIVWIKENFCIYICPYSRVQSVLFDEDTQSVIYNQKRGGAIYDSHLEKIPQPLKMRLAQAECIECQKCVRVCPTHIDIRAGMQLECINCLECADACQSVMGSKPSLIAWSSPNALANNTKVRYIRPKTIGYMLVLILAMVMAIYMGEKKQDLLLNITRPTSLYTLHQSGLITNEYMLLIENKTDQNGEFIIELEGHPDISIFKPKHSFVIHSRSKKRIVLVLQSTKSNSLTTKEQSIPIKLKILSKTNPALSITKESVFIYPHKESK